MRTSFRAYLIGVLLPVGLATVIFGEEMGQQTAELATTAPLLESPDPSTPILSAALQGDTVAALGLAGPDLVLSVALAVGEEPGGGGQPSPTLQLRAVTRLFPARSLKRFHGRTGLQVALFLRGTLVSGGRHRKPGQEWGRTDPGERLVAVRHPPEGGRLKRRPELSGGGNRIPLPPPGRGLHRLHYPDG